MIKSKYQQLQIDRFEKKKWNSLEWQFAHQFLAKEDHTSNPEE